MTPYYASLRFQLKKLHERNHLHSFWFFNGNLYIKKRDMDDKVLISHESDLYLHFKEVTDLDELIKNYSN